MLGRFDKIAMVSASVLIITCTLLTQACMVGPKYVRPSGPVPPAYKETGALIVDEGWKPAQPADAVSRGKWWERFGDPQLNQLEEKVSVSNQNVAAAAANVRMARAAIREARSQYLPTVAVDPGITNSRISTGFGKTLGIIYSTFSLPVEASWEPDLWGRVRNTVKSNTAAAQASAADLENVRLSAQSDLAADYFALRAQDALQQLYDSTTRAYQEALELNRDLYTSGLGNDEAVAQAETQLKVAQAQDTNLGVLRSQYEHAIALLIGQAASTFSIPVSVAKLAPPSIPLGVPSELLQRRPDIAAAERQVEQANAQIGIAQSAFYPNVTLSASAGFQSLSIAQWFAWPSRVWSVGTSLAETVFDAGLRRATVQQFQAAYDQTVANYRQTVLTAFQQVEDDLSGVRILGQVIEQQDSAVDAARRSLGESEVRYKSGLDPYLNVITAQTVLLTQQQASVSFRAQQMAASVQLLKALGGGWDTSKLPSGKDLAAGPSRSAVSFPSAGK